MRNDDPHVGPAKNSGLHEPFDVGPRPSPWLARLSDPDLALACMFALGSTQGVVVMSLPHWRTESAAIVLGVAVAGGLMAPLIWLLRGRLRGWSRQLGLVIGTAATTLAVFGCGAQPSTLSAAYFYFLVTLYAAAYFRPWSAAIHVSLVGVLYAAVLALHPAPAFPAQWIQTMSALAVVALIVGGFAAHVRSSAIALTDETFHDGLTGLANRARFLDRLDHAMAHARTSETSIAVLFMNLDDFKDVNDALGHRGGDQLLIAAARRLEATTDAPTFLARFSGDEFAALIEGDQASERAELLAGQLVAAFDLPFQVSGAQPLVGISIGIGVGKVGTDSAGNVLLDADLAMYEAKMRGKRCYVNANPGMLGAALAHLALVADLRRGLAEQQFEVFYQPIVSASSGRPTGAEALVRWHHPVRGLVLPGEFIDTAETAGLITELGMWVLGQACSQAQFWRCTRGLTAESFYVSVNLSPRQLADPTLIPGVGRALRESGLPPSALVLEITESSLMSDFETGLARLRDLKQMGVRLALDDYGTGYSSLSRLRRLPVDIVKVDKSFVDQVCESREGSALVRSITDVTRTIGLISVAEGVETAGQCQALAELGCDAFQGYFFAKPAPAPDTTAVLRRLFESSPPTSAAPPAHNRLDRAFSWRHR